MRETVVSPMKCAVAGRAFLMDSPVQGSIGSKLLSAIRQAPDRVNPAVKIEATGGWKIRTMLLASAAGKNRIERRIC